VCALHAGERARGGRRAGAGERRSGGAGSGRAEAERARAGEHEREGGRGGRERASMSVMAILQQLIVRGLFGVRTLPPALEASDRRAFQGRVPPRSTIK